MTVRVNKGSFNIREKLTELGRRFGLKGSELAAAETVQEARDLVSAGRKNIVINGAMMVDQRNSGASATPSGTYTYFIDRYAMWYSTGSGHTIQQVSDSPVGFGNSLQLTVGTGGSATGTEYGRLTYSIEGYDALPLELGSSNAQAFTVSFYVKVSVAGTYGVQLHGTTATIKYQSSFSISGGEVNNWVRRSFTVPAGTFITGTFNETNGAALTIAFDLGEGPGRSMSLGYHSSVNTGGALGLTGGTKILETSGATYQLTGLQLEVGKNATEFEHRSYGEEFALCQRYYQTINNTDSFGAPNYGPTANVGWQYHPSAGSLRIYLPTTMRAEPAASLVGTLADSTTTPSISSDGTIGAYGAGGWMPITSVNPTETTKNSVRIDVAGLTGSAKETFGFYFYGSTLTSNVNLDAEL